MFNLNIKEISNSKFLSYVKTIKFKNGKFMVVAINHKLEWRRV